jgi:hypothetical protein
LALIPKAQDAMTSVVYLYIVSTTSTGDPVNRPWWNSCYTFGYYTHTHAFCGLFFFILSLKVVYLSLKLTQILRNCMFPILIFANFKFTSLFNKKFDWNWKCQSVWNKMSLTYISPVCKYYDVIHYPANFVQICVMYNDLCHIFFKIVACEIWSSGVQKL